MHFYFQIKKVHYFFYLKIEMHDSREIVKFLGINIT
jgi:hypothetical protein